MSLSRNKIISLLNLKPLPGEGGYYRETYRAGEKISAECLPNRNQSAKEFSTAIYYLLTPDTFSALHLLPTDELFHFYLGDPVEMLQLYPDGSGKTLILGQDIENGMSLQTLVPQNTWQGSRLLPGGNFALLGTTVAPAFDFTDSIPADKDYLLKRYPKHAEMIVKLI